MKRLHRYLLGELLQNAALTVVAVMAIFFVTALALVLGTSRAQGVPFSLVMVHVGYRAVSTLYLTLPLTVLSACIFTYGRARADGEFTAIRVAGVHPFRTLLPALFLGALAMGILAWAQGELIPDAHFSGRVELEQDVFENIESILKRKDRTIEEDSWSARWEGLHQDRDGHIVLGGLQLLSFDKQRNLREVIRARWATPALDSRTNCLTLKMRDLWRQGADGKRPVQAGSFSVTLNLDTFATGRKSKRESDRTYEELITEARREAARSRRATVAKQRDRWRESSLENWAEYHQRIAFAFSALLFSGLGAVLGLYRGTGNRALVFLTGFLIVIGIYYPLQMGCKWFAEAGLVPVWLAFWIGNGVILALTFGVYRKLLRP